MTSRFSIGGCLSDINERVMNLRELSSLHAKELFFKKAPREIEQAEINDLFLNTNNQVRFFHSSPLN
jgi:hypothetical protein